MKITAQEEYGLRCLIAVARRQPDDQPLAISVIAKSEGLSTQYVAKLLNLLRQHNLVVSVRGLSGGFKLARPAHTISVIEVLQALGGAFEIGNQHICSHFAGKRDRCIHLPKCSLRPMWFTIMRHISEFLQHLTIHDLLAEEDKAEQRMQNYLRTITSAAKSHEGETP